MKKKDNIICVLAIILARNILVRKIREIQTTNSNNIQEKIAKDMALKITRKILGEQNPSFFYTTGLIKDFILFCSQKRIVNKSRKIEAAELIIEYHVAFINNTPITNRCIDCVTNDLARIMNIDIKTAKEFLLYLYEKKGIIKNL